MALWAKKAHSKFYRSELRACHNAAVKMTLSAVLLIAGLALTPSQAQPNTNPPAASFRLAMVQMHVDGGRETGSSGTLWPGR